MNFLGTRKIKVILRRVVSPRIFHEESQTGFSALLNMMAGRMGQED